MAAGVSSTAAVSPGEGGVAAPLATAGRRVRPLGSIGAASIVAKVTRDRIMAEHARDYPGYGWETNRGYGTPHHFRALKELGLTESLDIGYRLSPRGEAVVDDGGPPRERPAPPGGTRLPAIGAPATRALTAAGITTLEAVAAVPEAELAAMHGVGPVAIARLREALADAGLSYRAT